MNYFSTLSEFFEKFVFLYVVYIVLNPFYLRGISSTPSAILLLITFKKKFKETPRGNDGTNEKLGTLQSCFSTHNLT